MRIMQTIAPSSWQKTVKQQFGEVFGLMSVHVLLAQTREAENTASYVLCLHTFAVFLQFCLSVKTVKIEPESEEDAAFAQGRNVV